jgi:hypothetical protein
VVVALVVTVATAQVLPAPKDARGFGSPPAQSPSNTNRRIVVAIGIDQYTGWPKLGTAVSDAQAFSSLLTDKFGFTQLEKLLLDGAATKNNILALVEDRLRVELKKDDDVIFFFAGHGTTRTDEVGGEKIETGYLVPVEASAPGAEERWSDYIQMDELLEAIGKLPAEHILVILDACHSGFALGKALQVVRDAPRYQRDLESHVSRKVITSARQSQLASDGGPIPKHSLFTGLLLQGLEWGKADLDGNGVVTSSELGLYIQQAVGTSTESRQTPDFGSFYFDDRGEMVIPLDDHTYAGIKSRAFSALRWSEYKQFHEFVAKASELRPGAPETLYLQYRVALLDKRIPDAAGIVTRLIDMNVSEGQIPLSREDLWDLKERLPYWKPVLLLPEEGFPLRLALEGGMQESNIAGIVKIKLGDTTAYAVKPHFRFRWKVTNVSQQTMFMYALAIDQDGRLFPFSPWTPGPIILKGLQPGAMQATAFLRQDGALELQEFHFIASPNVVYALLSPVSVATRGISALDPDELRRATQAVERYTTMDVTAHEMIAGK